MHTPPAPAQDAATAIAQAIGAILRAMLDALFGDISGLAPRHPIRRAYARTLQHIARYEAALAAALTAPQEETPATPRPDSAQPETAPTPAIGVIAQCDPPTARTQSRAPPNRVSASSKPRWPGPLSHGHFVTISQLSCFSAAPA